MKIKDKISQKKMVDQNFAITEEVENSAIANLMFSVFALIASVYAIVIYVIPYCNSDLMIDFVNLFAGTKLGMFKKSLIPDTNRLTEIFPELNANLYVEWAAKLLVISALTVIVVLILNILDSIFLLLWKKKRSMIFQFYVVDMALCIATYASLAVIAVSAIHFSIMFIISIVILGDTLLWYAIIIGVGILAFIIAAALGIKKKVKRLTYLSNSRENLGTYILGILICLLPFIVSALTLILLGVAIGFIVLAFLVSFAGGLGDETSNR